MNRGPNRDRHAAPAAPAIVHPVAAAPTHLTCRGCGERLFLIAIGMLFGRSDYAHPGRKFCGGPLE